MARLVGAAAREPRITRRSREHQIVYGTYGGRCWPRAKQHVKERKRPASELVTMLDLRGIRQSAIRPLSTYRPGCGDLQKQLFRLVEHMFVEYTVPRCLYFACLPGDAPFVAAHPMYRQWLIAIGRGYSFAKAAQPYLTAREAHLFLSAPVENRVHENVWWAKLKASGLPDETTRELVDRIFTYFFFIEIDGRLAETVQFYARCFHEMDRADLCEITDCIEWKLRNEPNFKMKGRTLSSMIKLAKRWQLEMQKAKLRKLIEWPGLQINDWKCERKGIIWVFSELRTNIDLLREGRQQKHCVFSYTSRCEAGNSSIFSMRGYRHENRLGNRLEPMALENAEELSRITIEVNNRRAIVQVRGHLNRAPSEEERFMLRLWAREKHLVFQ